MINDIYEQNGKAYRITQENPMMGVEYGFDGMAFKSIGEPIRIDSMHRITLSIVKIRNRIDNDECGCDIDPVENDVTSDESDTATRTEIMKRLDAMGITYNARANKADLLKLLED